MKINLSAPKQITWLVALVLAVLGVLGYFVQISFLSAADFWLVLLGFVVLLVGTLVEGL
jgi:predicted membrane channel-forming protein YqfA (hemolysin III family)